MTPVAASGPSLATVIVYVIVWPTLGVALLTCLPTTRSACCGVTVAAALLLAGSGSYWSLWLIVAVFVSELGLTTRAVSVKVGVADGSTVPTLQKPAL